ncbi:MAG: hypothetical protein U1U88_001668 [Lawsonella clevelandensis]
MARPTYLLGSDGPFGAFVLPGMLLIIFIETGLLFPLLPGDSLLFTAGFLSIQPNGFAPHLAGLPLRLDCGSSGRPMRLLDRPQRWVSTPPAQGQRRLQERTPRPGTPLL